MKSSPPFAAFILFFGIALLLGNLSCSNQPAAFKLTVKYEPVGKLIEYKLDSHRVGSAYKEDTLVEDFDIKVEADLIYTTQKVLENGNYLILEENVWSWDEPSAEDSGQIKRVTKDYAYKYQITPRGEMIDLKMLAKQSQVWEDYVKSYTDQGWPIFPDEKISVGHKWTQSVSVTLPDSEVVEARTDYVIKGTAQKQGYNCAIIEYKGNMALPLFPDPADSTSAFGVDYIEMNGILYFAIDAGVLISSEERRRVVAERTYRKKKEVSNRRSEFEAHTSYHMTSIGSS